MSAWQTASAEASDTLAALGLDGRAKDCREAKTPDDAARCAWNAMAASGEVRKVMVHLGIAAGMVLAARALAASTVAFDLAAKAGAAEERAERVTKTNGRSNEEERL